MEQTTRYTGSMFLNGGGPSGPLAIDENDKPIVFFRGFKNLESITMIDKIVI